MNSLKDLTLKDYDYICKYNPVPSVNKTIFWDSFGSENTPKCLNNQTIDAMKVTGITVESLSEVKKLENVSNINRSNHLRGVDRPTRNSNTRSKIPKRSHKVDAAKPVNTIQHQGDSAHSLLHGSWSEPSFDVTGDLKDNIALPDDGGEGTSKINSKRRPGDGKSLMPKNRIVKGCIYIKNAGNIYKSAVVAKSLQVYDKDVLKIFPRSRSSSSKNEPGQNMHGKNVLKCQTDEAGDFEVAIYLSGLVSGGDGENKKQNTTDSESMQQRDGEAQYNSGVVQKKKQSRAIKSNASSRVKTSRFSHQINKQNVALDISGDDSGAEYELKESGTIVLKRKTEENLESNLNDVSNCVKKSDSGQLSCRSRKSTRSRIVTSLSSYSTGFGCIKPKVTEEEMWEHFEVIFKK